MWIGCSLNPIAMSTLTQPADAHLGRRREFKNRHSQLNLLLELLLAITKRLLIPTLNPAQPYLLSILSSSVPDPSSSSLISVNSTTNNNIKRGCWHCQNQEPTKVLFGSRPAAAKAVGSFLGSNGPASIFARFLFPWGRAPIETDGESPFSCLSQWWLTGKIKYLFSYPTPRWITLPGSDAPPPTRYP